jgi:hypothetical protein
MTGQHIHPTRTDYAVSISHTAPGPNLPQQVGRILWLPMLLLALMAFPLALALGIARAGFIGAGGDAALISALGHFGPAAMFIGFASVFAAISFAIARILGVFRTGGGAVQEASGRVVQTLRMPATARAFLGLMMMAMMILVAAVIGHVVVGAGLLSGTLPSVTGEQWAIWLEAARRVGVATYLLAISLGLATIVVVLGFQIRRLRELPAERPH